MDRMALVLCSNGLLSLLLLVQRGPTPGSLSAIAHAVQVAESLEGAQVVRALHQNQETTLSLHSMAVVAGRVASCRPAACGRCHLHSKLQIYPSAYHQKYSIHGNRSEQSLLVEAWSPV